MEHSGNDLIGCNFDLTYRKGQFRFYNKMSFDYSKEDNPTVKFQNMPMQIPILRKEMQMEK